jgi:glycosyltransferase involved in cell wall biosynthesis
MLQIAIDAIGIHYSGGGRSSILNLLQYLFKLDHSNQYLIFLSQYEPSLETRSANIKQYILPFKDRFAVRLYAQVVVPVLIRGFDLVHFSKNLGLFGPLPPSIVTIHDLTTILFPKAVPRLDHFYWRSLQRITVQNAKMVTTVSYMAAKDIERIYHIPLDKIRVIHHGCSKIFRPSTTDEIMNIKRKYGILDQYILHVGRIDIKKNLTLLVKSYYQFSENTGFNGKLVFVGETYKKSIDVDLQPTIGELGLQNAVIFTGHVPDQDLPPLYSGAFLCVFPSMHEGFGLAQLEAMTCGAPIISHKAGAVEEVVGDAAIIIENIDVENLAEQMSVLYNDNDLREDLRKRGLIRARDFSWETAAEKLLDVYNEVGLRKK